MGEPFFEIIKLSKTYHLWRHRGKSKTAHTALDNVSLSINVGETLAVVGESGSGKTTLGRCLLRLIEPTRGQILHDGSDLCSMPEKAFRRLRPKFQMIFQNPAQALNPRQTVAAAIKEPLRLFGQLDKRHQDSRMMELLTLVGLSEEIAHRLPYQLSTGQKQRVAIARALATKPVFLVADEPTASLDAMIKLQVIELLADLKHRFGLTLLLITHDLAMVFHAADRVAILCRGTLVEIAPAEVILTGGRHPYTKLLLNAAGLLRDADSEEVFDSPIPKVQTQGGCVFADRCPYTKFICHNEAPALKRVTDNHQVACHLSEESLVELPPEQHEPAVVSLKDF